MNGSPERSWAVRRPDGTFVALERGDGLPLGREGRAARHGPRLRRQAPRQGRWRASPHGSCRSLVAANGAEPEGNALQVAETVRDAGPLTGPELREATGLPKKDVDKAIAALHHGVVLTSSHLVEQDGPWGALAHDLRRAQVAAARAPAGSRQTHGANWRASSSTAPAS